MQGTKLQDAWNAFAACPASASVAQGMVESETVYVIAWTPLVSGQGSITLGDESFLGGTQFMLVDSSLKDAPEKAAAHIAHESVHAREGDINNSLSEEVRAYNFQHKVGEALKIQEDPLADSLGILDPYSLDDLEKARAALERAGGLLGADYYRSLPLYDDWWYIYSPTDESG